MVRADVIGYLVLNNLYAQRVGLPDQLTQRFQVAEAVFNCVIIDRVITVVVRVWTPRLSAAVYAVPVVVPGGQPERRYTELFEICKVVNDAPQVAAMKATRVVSIVCLARRVCGRIP